MKMRHLEIGGVSLRVSTDSRQGGRKYMEDVISICHERGDEQGEEGDEFAYFAVFDGHGGSEAARFAEQHLLEEVTKQKSFWSSDDEQVMKAIKEAFISCHKLMWKSVGTWPKTLSGLPSTAGTTASVVFIKNKKIYVAHVGDSAVVIGQGEKCRKPYDGKFITVDHKPESPAEKKRIEESGGQVMAKSGVPRVVWNRPKITHKGPVRRSTHIDHIPFLAVARALGDLWSYNSEQDAFVVSPEPDISVYNLDASTQRCLVVASDGLWNMMKAKEAVSVIHHVELKRNHQLKKNQHHECLNPAAVLVRMALEKWSGRHMRADNTSAIVIIIDPVGEQVDMSRAPSRAPTLRLSDERDDIQLGPGEYILIARPRSILEGTRHATPQPNPSTTGTPEANRVAGPATPQVPMGPQGHKSPRGVGLHAGPSEPQSAPARLLHPHPTSLTKSAHKAHKRPSLPHPFGPAGNGTLSRLLREMSGKKGSHHHARSLFDSSGSPVLKEARHKHHHHHHHHHHVSKKRKSLASDVGSPRCGSCSPPRKAPKLVLEASADNSPKSPSRDSESDHRLGGAGNLVRISPLSPSSSSSSSSSTALSSSSSVDKNSLRDSSASVHLNHTKGPMASATPPNTAPGSASGSHSPKTGVLPKSPVKVDRQNGYQEYPAPGVTSPLWPNHHPGKGDEESPRASSSLSQHSATVIPAALPEVDEHETAAVARKAVVGKLSLNSRHCTQPSPSTAQTAASAAAGDTRRPVAPPSSAPLRRTAPDSHKITRRIHVKGKAAALGRAVGYPVRRIQVRARSVRTRNGMLCRTRFQVNAARSTGNNCSGGATKQRHHQ